MDETGAQPSNERPNMTASNFTSRPATSAELRAATELCLAAFADEAVITWVFPDPESRRSQLQAMFNASLESAVTTGALFLAIADDGELAAASIWAARDAREESSRPGSSPETDDEHSRRLAAVETATEARRPEPAHLHLSSMATLPSYRGRGAGSAMITAGLSEARKHGLPVYLEASNADNRRLYERFGFREYGGPIQLPDNGPSLQPMWLDT